MREGKFCARLCVTLLFFSSCRLARRVWWLSFILFFCERTQRDKGRLTCHQHLGCNSLRRGMPIIIISLFLSYSFTYYYYTVYVHILFGVFSLPSFSFFFLFSFPVFISLHTYKSLWRRVDSSSRRSVYTTTTQHTPKRKKKKQNEGNTKKKKFYDARLL